MKKKLLAVLLCAAAGMVQAQEKFIAYFDFDVAEADAPSVQKLSQWMALHPGVQVTAIEGFADAVGTGYYNTQLSERRAAYVLKQLQDNNLAVSETLQLTGSGERFARGGQNAADRKVVITYVPKDNSNSSFSAKVKQARTGDKLRLPNLNFYNYSDRVLPQSERVLWELLDAMLARPGLRIDIQGHICCQEMDVDSISLKRAQAVYNFLLRGGIEKTRLSYQSFSSTRPVYPLPEQSEEERIANRRVEIQILDSGIPATDAASK